MFSKHTRGARRYRSVTDPAAAGSAAGSVAGSVARKRKKIIIIRRRQPKPRPPAKPKGREAFKKLFEACEGGRTTDGMYRVLAVPKSNSRAAEQEAIRQSQGRRSESIGHQARAAGAEQCGH
jgi:hypothetical protein